MKEMSRRELLKGGLVGGAAIAAMAALGGCSAEKPAPSLTPGEANQRVSFPYASQILDLAKEIISTPQIYTEEQKLEIPAVLNAKHRYFWCVDLQDYEAMRDVYTDEGPGGFRVDWGTGEQSISIDEQIASAKATTGPGENMVPMHFGHNQIVRFIDDTHAQILTRMNDRHTYHDDGEVYAGWGLYVDDVMKCSDGACRMTCVRLAYGVMENQLRAMKQQQDG